MPLRQSLARSKFGLPAVPDWARAEPTKTREKSTDNIFMKPPPILVVISACEMDEMLKLIK